MKRWCSWCLRLLLVACFLGGVFTTSGCRRNKKSSAKKGKRRGKRARWGRYRRKKPTKPVHAALIRLGDIDAILAGTATLEAEERVTILTQVQGLARRVYGVEGKRFRRGSTLAILSNNYLKIADEQLAAEIDKIKLDLKRNARLVKRGFVSKEDDEQLRFQLRQKKIQRKKTREDLRNLRLRATISGVVTKRTLRRGAWVTPNTEVFAMEDPSSLVAMISVPEKYISYLKKGLKAVLLSEALGTQKPIKGEVIRVAPTVDPKTGTVQVAIGKLKPLKVLRSGMFVSVRLVLERRIGVPLVPKQAVLYENNRPVVYRLTGKKSACKVNLQAKQGRTFASGGRGGWRKRLRSMTPEQRAKMRKRLRSMSPEQRKAWRRKMRKRRGGGKKGRGGRGRWGGAGGKKGGARCQVEKVFFEKGIENEKSVEVLSGLKAGDKVVTLGQEDLQKKASVRVVKLD